MLLQREICAAGTSAHRPGRISAPTHAMTTRATVSRYLLMQPGQWTYGITVAIGLAFIGEPNAVLWGAFDTVLRSSVCGRIAALLSLTLRARFG